jgi:RNA methyltransferase, TrmH family
MPATVTSRSNPAFQRLRRLAQDGRARDREGRSLLEGAHLIEAWLDRGLPIERLVVDALALGSPEISRLLARAPAQATLVLPPALMAGLSTLESAALIVAEIVPLDGRMEATPGKDVVLLDGVQDPGNVGAILRTAAAAGVRHVIAGPGTAALWSPKVLRAAMGAHALLNLVTAGDLPQAIAALGVPALGTSSHARLRLHEQQLPVPCAWVFGHEGRGLSPAVESALSMQVAIDQQADVESLNVAAAAAVCLFEARRQRAVARAPELCGDAR